MRNIIYIIALAIGLNASEYYAKIEPYKTYSISSELSAKVEFVDKKKEYSLVKQKALVLKLDSTDEDIEFDSAKKSLLIQEEVLKIKQSNYKNKAKVIQLSIYDKNQEKLSYLDSRQIVEDLKKNIKVIQKQKKRKEFFVEDKYLKEIYVNKGEYVQIGQMLFELYDFSKSKLEVFVRPNDIEDLKQKSIYINDKKSEYKIEKVSKVRDTQRVSTYKVILYKDKPNPNIKFGEIVKVEFRK